MKFEETIKPVVPNIDTLYKRFMNNHALIFRFMKRFLDDKNAEQIKTAITMQNYEDIYIHAHTLKGVSANLGLDYLSEACDDIVTYFRQDGMDILKYEKLYEKVIKEYDKAISCIKLID